MVAAPPETVISKGRVKGGGSAHDYESGLYSAAASAFRMKEEDVEN